MTLLLVVLAQTKAMAVSINVSQGEPISSYPIPYSTYPFTQTLFFHTIQNLTTNQVRVYIYLDYPLGIKATATTTNNQVLPKENGFYYVDIPPKLSAIIRIKVDSSGLMNEYAIESTYATNVDQDVIKRTDYLLVEKPSELDSGML
ncbi:hypothetical protein Thena_1654 [Thermodesulfobium narugense DSM 14796]|uniref:Uncharacterized protein n=1 Tax=Thermodesulfobium narugense DSM 14796 TaxID=747365 RepID=M1E9H0_9BACT|nr:hypothetical protein [Thermodesulfobium narugense]AEE15264.1 hypothetical protein Thena_1654 [Thermodesulfobium narugense DSM 14796]